MTTKETPEPQNVDDWIKAEAAKDYEGLLVQFRAMKCLLNSQGERLSWYANRDYSLSERRLNELTSSLESEREMNAELTAEVERLSHPKQEPSGDVDLTKCPKCGGVADNGNDRCIPPNPYECTKCTETSGDEDHHNAVNCLQAAIQVAKDGKVPNINLLYVVEAALTEQKGQQQ